MNDFIIRALNKRLCKQRLEPAILEKCISWKKLAEKTELSWIAKATLFLSLPVFANMFEVLMGGCKDLSHKARARAPQRSWGREGGSSVSECQHRSRFRNFPTSQSGQKDGCSLLLYTVPKWTDQLMRWHFFTRTNLHHRSMWWGEKRASSAPIGTCLTTWSHSKVPHWHHTGKASARSICIQAYFSHQPGRMGATETCRSNESKADSLAASLEGILAIPREKLNTQFL